MFTFTQTLQTIFQTHSLSLTLSHSLIDSFISRALQGFALVGQFAHYSAVCAVCLNFVAINQDQYTT